MTVYIMCLPVVVVPMTESDIMCLPVVVVPLN